MKQTFFGSSCVCPLLPFWELKKTGLYRLLSTVYRWSVCFIFWFILFFASPLIAGEQFSSMTFKELLPLAVCAEMNTLGQECGMKPKESANRQSAVQTALDDLWSLNYGEKSPFKDRQAAIIVRRLIRLDLGVLVKNPKFAKMVFLRGELGIHFLLERNQKDDNWDRLTLPPEMIDQVSSMGREAEDLFNQGKYIEMRTILYQALWLAMPLTAGQPLPDLNGGQDVVYNLMGIAGRIQPG